jgi:hypothetical protein
MACAVASPATSPDLQGAPGHGSFYCSKGECLTVLLLGLLLAVPVPGDGLLGQIESGSDGFAAILNTPAPYLEQAGEGYWPCAPGMSASLLEGDLIRPCYTFYVPLPPGASPSIQTDILSRASFEPGRAYVQATVPVLSGAGLETVETYPSAPVSEGPGGCFEVETCEIAGTRIARVTFFPFVGRDFTSYVSRARIILSWGRAPGAAPLDSHLLSLICPEGVLWWPPRPRPDNGPGIFWGHPWARLVVSFNGCYSVTCEELERAGCEIEGSPAASLRMFTGPGRQFELQNPADEHQLVEMAIEVIDGGDGSFDSSDSLVFLGRTLNRYDAGNLGDILRLSHRYSISNVYWLTWGDEPGLRIQSREAAPDGSPQWGAAAPDRMRREEDWMWMPVRETRTGWVWTKLETAFSSYIGFYTPGVAGTADLELCLVYDSSGTHRSLLFLGDVQLGDTLVGVGTGRSLFTVEDVSLAEGTNTLRIATIGPSLGTYFDYLDITWQRTLTQGSGRDILFPPAGAGRYTFAAGGLSGTPRFFDWTDPYAPVRLAGLQVAGSSASFSLDVGSGSRLFLADEASIRKPDSISSASPGRIIATLAGGDVAIVAGPGMLEGATIIEAACEARGLQAHAVSVREVYDEFGQGVKDPGAIRSFIRWMLDTWSPSPRMVILIGDGHYDPLRHITPEPDLVPAMIMLGGDEGMCSDDYYAITSPGSTAPELPMCRIPADSPSDLSIFISKELGYASGAADGGWANRLLVAADDEWGIFSQNERDHTLFAEMLADTIVPQSIDRVKFYMIEYPWPVGGREKPEAREAFVQALSEGCAAAVFIGHGSYGQIAHEKLFISSDIDRLTNGWRLPLLSFASCDVGRFEMTSTDCMAEDFVMRPSGGAIGTIAATRGTTSASNRALFTIFFENLYSDSVLPGEALWAAKLLSQQHSYYNKYYVFFGDGSLPLRSFDALAQPLAIDGGLFLRGRMNGVSAVFPEPATVLLEVGESGAWTDYTCLGGSILTYLKYGRPAFRGTFPVEDLLDVSFFMPVQSDTGNLARAAADGLLMPGGNTAWNEWAVVSDSGGFAADSTGPAIEIWMEGHEGEDNPSVGSQPVLRARLSDPSGIAAFGGSAGRAILVNVDKAVFDATGDFSYTPGSSVAGELTFATPYLFEGPHSALVAAWDGMGNGSVDTLSFSVSAASGDLLSEVLVYPNPGEGQRCFSFRSDAPGTAEIAIYTVAGRKIWSGSFPCGGGYGQVLWNGLDMDGDPPASGPYVFRIGFASGDGRDDDYTGILAVIREE